MAIVDIGHEPMAKRGRSDEAEKAFFYFNHEPFSRVQKKSKTDNAVPLPSNVKNRPEQRQNVSAENFTALDVDSWLVRSLEAMAITQPTKIQSMCIPEILKGKDCIGGSRTGSGKTIAFTVPILQQWAKDPFGIYALILTPTRYIKRVI